MSILGKLQSLADRIHADDPKIRNCPMCIAHMDLAIYGRCRETPEQVAMRFDDLCRAHAEDIRQMLADAVRQIREARKP